MRIITKFLKSHISTSATPNQSPLSAYNFPFPYEYTLYPQQFKFIDYRFQQYPVVQKFFPLQQQHVKYVLQLFEKLVNKNISQKATSQFIDNKLISKVKQYKQILKEMQSSIQIKIQSDKIDSSLGYLQCYGYNPQLFIHEYIVTKKDEKLMLIVKQQLQNAIKKQGEQQLQKDIEQINKANSVGEKIKQKLFKDKSEKSEIGLKIFQFFEKSYEKSQQQKKFKSYFLINKINSKMNIRITSNGKKQAIQKFDNIQLTTKWYYNITNQQPQSVKKSRKRILFDFQMWNRGTFIPIKNFVQ